MKTNFFRTCVLVLLLCAVLSAQSFAFVLDEGKTYAAAVNTNLSIANSPISASYEDAPLGSLQDGAGIYDVCYDSLGNPLVQLAPDLPAAQPLGADEAHFGTFRAESPRGNYVAGESTKTVTCRKIVSGANQYLPYEMHCLWVGTHCTVWGTTSDDEAVRISAENAAIVGQEFDAKYDAMAEAFGAFSIDADGDGKVALLCYDIDGNYETNPNGYYGGYYAGYFWMQDLISADGKIGGIRFSGALVQNGLDCLHLDTYPGMGNRFEDVSRCFSTIVHEYQHMINFASRLLPNAVRSEIPTFLDEAFAMAAEHLIYGDQSTQSRVSYFNSSSSSLGSPLTAWQNTLDNYANSYLFGQYLRTRYAQLGFEGDTIYGQILQIHRDTNKDVLEIIGELLGDTPQNIVCDFWLAVALKAPYGKYGFGGEAWAEKINARLSSGTIHNGGARYYLSTNVPATQNDNLKIIYFDKSNLEHIHLPTATAAVAPTCTAAGNSAYWTCSVCGKFFSDEACTTEIAKDSWILSPIEHILTEHKAISPTHVAPGNIAYWSCASCGRFYADAACTEEIAENSWILDSLGYDNQTLTENIAQNTQIALTRPDATLTLDHIVVGAGTVIDLNGGTLNFSAGTTVLDLTIKTSTDCGTLKFDEAMPYADVKSIITTIAENNLKLGKADQCLPLQMPDDPYTYKVCKLHPAGGMWCPKVLADITTEGKYKFRMMPRFASQEAYDLLKNAASEDAISIGFEISAIYNGTPVVIQNANNGKSGTAMNYNFSLEKAKSFFAAAKDTQVFFVNVAGLEKAHIVTVRPYIMINGSIAYQGSASPEISVFSPIPRIAGQGVEDFDDIGSLPGN